jgi:hypothetical protein
MAQSQELPPGTIHSFATGGVTFHTYVSPAQAVHVTAHIVEFDNQLLLVDATFIPPTAMEVAAAMAAPESPSAWRFSAMNTPITGARQTSMTASHSPPCLPFARR